MTDSITGAFSNFSQPAANNQAPISVKLAALFPGPARILEIGSGSGQHAVAMATHLPQLVWQPTDQGDYYPGLVDNIERLAPANVLPPLYLDIATSAWPATEHVYAANVLHIMSAKLLPAFFAGAAAALAQHGKLCLYGPYKYAGQFTTTSNADFDEWLRARNPDSGIRDMEMVQQLATANGLTAVCDDPMPANNQWVVFAKT